MARRHVTVTTTRAEDAYRGAEVAVTSDPEEPASAPQASDPLAAEAPPEAPPRRLQRFVFKRDATPAEMAAALEALRSTLLPPSAESPAAAEALAPRSSSAQNLPLDPDED